MNKVVINNNLKLPDYFYRQFNHDLRNRIVLTALPFLTLYKPLTKPISLASDSCRIFSNLSQIFKSGQSNAAVSIELIKTTITVTAFICTLAQLPLGMLITTSHDIFITISEIKTHLSQNDKKAAYEKLAQLINSTAYLGLFFFSGLEILIFSLLLQILLTGYSAKEEFQKDHYIEATGHLLMAIIRTYQLQAKIQLFYPAPQAIPVKTAQIKAIEPFPLPKEGQEPVIYHSDTSKQFRKAYLKSIMEAKKSILIMSFTFSDEEIIHLLAKKAAQGVKVTLVVDRHLMDTIKPYANRFTLLTRATGEGHFHHKVMVLDEAIVWIGSANFSPDSLTLQNNTMIGLYNKTIARALLDEKDAIIGLKKRSTTPFPPLEIGEQKVELLLFPHIPYTTENPPEQTLNDYGKKRVLELIDSAKVSLRLAICVWTNQELVDAVIRAKKRGVDVQVILWKEIESGATPNMLRHAGIPVIQKPHLPLMHNKWMIIDEDTFYSGSANWSKSWFSRNDESALILNRLRENQRRYLIDYWNKLLRS